MADELPPIWALDKAAKAAGWHDGWQTVMHGITQASIIAHARTIAQYEQPPVDEDEEALKRVLDAYFGAVGRSTDDWYPPHSVKDALAQFKRELEGRK